jgi:hypothetical protein
MRNSTLNKKIEALDDQAYLYQVAGLAQHGKTIPYLGWYWREVDFSKPVTLGDGGSFIGFMENNKWGYPEWQATKEQSQAIRAMLEDAVTVPTTEKLQAVFDYIQTCKPEGHNFDEQWQKPEGLVFIEDMLGTGYTPKGSR